MGSNKTHNNISLHFKQNYFEPRPRETEEEIEAYEKELAKERAGKWSLKKCEEDIRKQIDDIMKKVKK